MLARPRFDLLAFPTPLHRQILEGNYGRFVEDEKVTAMLLINSLARGLGDRYSDLDFAIFVAPDNVAEYKAIGREIRAASAAAGLETHVAATALTFYPGEMDVNDIDPYEIRIGNFIAYPMMLFDRHGEWEEARSKYLPYYDELLARKRELRWKELALYQSERVRVALDRQCEIEAAHRLSHTLQVFFGGLFTKHRKYPIDYAKRIEMQVEEILGLPQVAVQAKQVLAFDASVSRTVWEAHMRLEELIGQWL